MAIINRNFPSCRHMKIGGKHINYTKYYNTNYYVDYGFKYLFNDGYFYIC